jgi:hypothetical protein
VVLPKGCRFVYIGFLHEVSLVSHARKFNWTSVRWRFPPGLSLVKLDLVGRENLILEEGIHGLGVKEGHASVSLTTLHEDLVRKGMFDRESFDDFMPPWRDGHLGYFQV